MNVRESNDEASSDVFFANFNQDCTSLAVSNKNGYKLFAFTKVDELEVIHENSSDDVRIIERLFSSSLIALVTVGAPRKLKVCHFKKNSEICNYSYSNTILAVKLNRARLVVCLEESLYIHNIRDMKVLHTIRDTPPNPLGLCVLSSSNDNNFLAYPGSSSIGEVQIFDVLNLCSKNMIPAHDNPLVAMAFDFTGTKIATASEKGTVIRVFNVLDKTKLYEFRRGVKRCVRIYSLCFSEDSNFLCASSNTETVHIFRLDDPREIKPVEETQSWTSFFGNMLSSPASMIPHVADMFYQGRSFATVHLPFSGSRNICVLATIEKILRVLVLSSEGILYIYNVDTNEGGDCVLECTHAISDNLENSNGSKSKENNSAEATMPSLPTETSNVSANIAVNMRRPLQTGSSSYAAVVRGSDGSSAQETQQDSDSGHKDPTIHSLLRYDLKVDYENDFPPMVHKSAN